MSVNDGLPILSGLTETKEVKKMGKVIFISGPITDEPNYKNNFICAERKLKLLGYEVVNPTILPIISDWDRDVYMDICINLLCFCDSIYMLIGYNKSIGALQELEFARRHGKEIIYER